MDNHLRIMITVDAERSKVGPVLPHTYSMQIDYLRTVGNIIKAFGIDDRTSIMGIHRNLKELQAEIADFHPDILVAYYGSVVGVITRLASKKIPYVITIRGSDWLGTSNPGYYWRMRDFLSHMCSLWSMNGAAQIAVSGSNLVQSLPARLQRKAHNLPTGVDDKAFRLLPWGEARSKLGWSLDEKVILFNAGVGSGKEVKNMPLAILVIKYLQEQFYEVRMEAISTCNRNEVCLRMNASDCLLVTSLHEGSPSIVKEALACNLPIVSTPCGDVEEQTRGVKPGMICPYDARELAQAIAPILASRQRSNGREQLFKQGLDIESVTQRVLAVYRLAVESQP